MQVQIVGNKANRISFGQFFDHRVASGIDPHLAAIGEPRPLVAVLHGDLCQAAATSSSATRSAAALIRARLRCRKRSNVLKQAPLERQDFIFGIEDFAFQLFQLRSGEPFRIRQRLFAFVGGRRELQGSPLRSRCSSRKHC